MRVEMHTGASKTPLQGLGGSSEKRAALISLALIMLQPEAGRWTGGRKVSLEYLATNEGRAIVG